MSSILVWQRLAAKDHWEDARWDGQRVMYIMSIAEQHFDEDSLGHVPNPKNYGDKTIKHPACELILEDNRKVIVSNFDILVIRLDN